MKTLDPKVWGPHYWFFLHTIAMTYPHHPNAVTKKKYYEFVQNIPLFIPIDTMASDFSKLIDLYPVSPYLDNRESFIRWLWFIHNKINEKLEKPKITLNAFYVKYYEEYKPTDAKTKEFNKIKTKLVYGGLITIILGSIYYLYDK
jgi:FAD-linked sulfhydryl oxidase